MPSKARSPCSAKQNRCALKSPASNAASIWSAAKAGCGADAFGTLKRSDFGLQNSIPFIGDEVRLRIQVEAYLP